MIKLIELTENQIEDVDEIIIYGAEIWGMLAYNAIERMGFLDKVTAIIDYRKAGSKFNDITIKSPDYLSTLPKDKTILVCASRGVEGICKNLEKIGYKTAYHIGEILPGTDPAKFEDRWDFSSLNDAHIKYMTYVNKYTKSNGNKIILPILGVTVTEYCTLKCRACLQHIPYLKDPHIYDFKAITNVLGRIIECVDSILQLELSGGEAVTHKRLFKIINWVCRQEKIKYVKVICNATFIPDKQNLISMNNDKLELYLDDYGVLSNKLNEWINICKQNHIKYSIMKKEYWNDVTSASKKNYDMETLKTVFTNCCFSECYDI
jgi:hypothetical protein